MYPSYLNLDQTPIFINQASMGEIRIFWTWKRQSACGLLYIPYVWNRVCQSSFAFLVKATFWSFLFTVLLLWTIHCGSGHPSSFGKCRYFVLYYVVRISASFSECSGDLILQALISSVALLIIGAVFLLHSLWCWSEYYENIKAIKTDIRKNWKCI